MLLACHFDCVASFEICHWILGASIAQAIPKVDGIDIGLPLTTTAR